MNKYFYILKPDDGTTDQQMMEKIEPLQGSIFIVLGNSSKADELAKKAGIMALDRPGYRFVFWINQPNVIEKISLHYLSSLEGGLSCDRKQVLGFVLNPKSKKVKYIIRQNDSIGDLLVNKAYATAEAK